MTAFKRSSSQPTHLILTLSIAAIAGATQAGTLIISSPSAAPAPAALTAAQVEQKAVPVPAPLPTFELLKGRRVDQQLTAYAQSAGWSLVWEAPEFVIEQRQVLPGSFEESIEFFLRGANEAGIRLRGVFYRGNRTVRITEF